VTKDNFIVSNGYTVAHYPRGISFDLTQVERTFISLLAEQGWNYDYMFGPQRPPLLTPPRTLVLIFIAILLGKGLLVQR
jgi:hypothetical protein